MDQSKHLCRQLRGHCSAQDGAASLPLSSSGSLQESAAPERDAQSLSAVGGGSHYPHYLPQGNQIVSPVSEECPFCFSR